MVKALNYSSKTDVHDDKSVDIWIDPFSEAGADIITVHEEAEDTITTLKNIRKKE